MLVTFLDILVVYNEKNINLKNNILVMVSIGSRKPNAKVITINFKKKHLIFGGVLFFAVILFHQLVWSPYIYHYVICPDTQEKQKIDKETTIICDVAVPKDYTIKDKIKYYENKWIIQNRQSILT